MPVFGKAMQLTKLLNYQQIFYLAQILKLPIKPNLSGTRLS